MSSTLSGHRPLLTRLRLTASPDPSLLRLHLHDLKTLSKIPFTLDHLRIYRIGPAVKRVASKAPDSSKQLPGSSVPRRAAHKTEWFTDWFEFICCSGTRKVAEQLVDKWTKMQNAKPSDVKDPKRKADLADGKSNEFHRSMIIHS